MDLSATITIDRSVADVFDYVMHVPNDVEWRANVVEAAFTSDGPPGIGTTGFDRIESGGRETVAGWTVVDWAPGSHARWRLDSGPIRGTGGYICEAAGSGTRFTLEAHVTPTGWLRLLGPIFAMIGRRGNQADVRKLKAILEGG